MDSVFWETALRPERVIEKCYARQEKILLEILSALYHIDARLSDIAPGRVRARDKMIGFIKRLNRPAGSEASLDGDLSLEVELSEELDID